MIKEKKLREDEFRAIYKCELKSDNRNELIL